MIYGDWRFPGTLNPLQTSDALSLYATTPLFEGLFTYTSTSRLIPVQATVIPTGKNGGIRDGGRTIVFHLKRGMRWSNGAEITSADVRFGWKIAMDPATGPLCTGSCDVIRRIETPDRYTAVIRLKRIYAPAVPYAMPQLWPVRWPGAWNGDPHAAALKLEESTYDFEGPGYPTSGPYEVKSFVVGDRVVYWPMKWYTTMACGARVKTFIQEFFTSKAGLIAAAANRQVNISGGYSFAELPALGGHGGVFATSIVPAFIFEHIEFNLDRTYDGKPNPLADDNVRLALALALDKIGLLRSTLGVSARTARTLAAWTPWINSPALVQPYADRSITGQWDPLAHAYVAPGGGRALRDARSLLGRTAWKSGFPMDVLTGTDPVRAAAIDVMAANWARLGVTVRRVIVPGATLFGSWEDGGTLAHGRFQAATFFYQGAPDPDGLKFTLEGRYVDRTAVRHGPTNLNYSGIRDAVIDGAMERAGRSLQRRARAADYAIVQQRLNQRAYWIGLYFRPVITTTDRRVRGFANNPIAGPLANTWDWTVAQR